MAADEASPIYRDLMRFKPSGLTPNGWAVRAGVSRTVWADMRRHGNPSRRTLEKLLTAAGSSLAEFEALRLGAEAVPSLPGRVALAEPEISWGAAHLRLLPIIATNLAGEWKGAAKDVELIELRCNEIIGGVARPQSLANDADAFAVTVVGDAMWPRFRPGRLIAVSPRASVAVGDDVLVRLDAGRQDAQQVLIKQLVKRTSGFVELRQFNPDKTFAVNVGEVDAMHKIIGELI